MSAPSRKRPKGKGRHRRPGRVVNWLNDYAENYCPNDNPIH